MINRILQIIGSATVVLAIFVVGWLLGRHNFTGFERLFRTSPTSASPTPAAVLFAEPSGVPALSMQVASPSPLTTEAEPRHSESNALLTKEEAEGLYQNAFQAFENNNFEGASKFLDELDNRVALPESRNLRGVMAMRRGQYEKAEGAFNEALGIDRTFWNAQFNLGEIPLFKRDWPEARRRFQQLLSTQARELDMEKKLLIKFKILLTFLFEGNRKAADSNIAELKRSGDTPALNYANAASALLADDEKKAKNFLADAASRFSTQSNEMFGESLYEVGLLKRVETQSSSPYATAADFARYAMKVREQSLSKVEPQAFVPTSSRPDVARYPWKTNTVTTIFWIGEKEHQRSAWDAKWVQSYGGVDKSTRSDRHEFIPLAFSPKQNPFYCALPYNDLSHGKFKSEAPLVIPWFKDAYVSESQSVCWHRWLAIRKGNRTCYAQWEDVGPFHDDHFQYVFGNERPKPNANHGAGLNVSPAVRDYLGLQPTDVTDWQFVNTQDVLPGPWRLYGENNHFVIARREAEQRQAQQAAPSTAPASPNATIEADQNESKRFEITKVMMADNFQPPHGHFTLNIHVQKRQNEPVDGQKVKIQVFFFDKLGAKDIRLTDADISYAWITGNHDWVDPNTEILAVTYKRNSSSGASDERFYFGYVVSVYYDERLQDIRADPASLLVLFPPSLTPRRVN